MRSFTGVISVAFAVMRFRGFPEHARSAVHARVGLARLDLHPIDVWYFGESHQLFLGLVICVWNKTYDVNVNLVGNFCGFVEVCTMFFKIILSDVESIRNVSFRYETNAEIAKKPLIEYVCVLCPIKGRNGIDRDTGRANRLFDV